MPAPVHGSPEDAVASAAAGAGIDRIGQAGSSGSSGSAAVAPVLLPRSLSEALAAWQADEALWVAVTEGLGAPLVRAFMAVREGELAANPSLAQVLLRY